MFKQQSENILRFAHWVAKNATLKRILLRPYRYYQSFYVKKRNALFHKNGLDVLKVFDACMTEHNIPYTLAFGSMLGAVREHGFIKHDFDMDVAMWAEDYTPSLSEYLGQYGFSLTHELTVDDGQSAREETYELNGVRIDVFFIYPAIDQYPYCCDFVCYEDSYSFEDSMKRYGQLVARRLQLPWNKDLHRVPFEDTNLPVPVNAADILAFRYGDDYMIPNPGWSSLDYNKYTTVWEEKKAIYRKG